MQEVEYDLTVGFEYAHDGDMSQASHILLKAPTANYSRFTAKLKQGFFQAVRDFDQKDSNMTSQAEADSKKSIKGDEIVGAIMMSKSVDFGEYLDVFKDLMCKGVALVDGKEPFKKALFEKLTEEDLTSILAVYLENFLIASWMKKIT